MRWIPIVTAALLFSIPAHAADAGSDASGLAGASCSNASECASGFCVDGVCCNSACTGQCEACNVAGAEGACAPVIGSPRGSRPACDALSATDCAHKYCDGVSRTTCGGFANGPTVACGTAACAGGMMQKQGTCDGKGACSKPSAISCGPYACDPTTAACRADCSAVADCAASFDCRAGRCVPTSSMCSADRTAAVASDGTTVSCAPYLCNPATGTCQSTCVTDAECVSGDVCRTDRGQCLPQGWTDKANPDQSDEGACAFGRSSASLFGFALGALALAAMRRRAAR